MRFFDLPFQLLLSLKKKKKTLTSASVQPLGGLPRWTQKRNASYNTSVVPTPLRPKSAESRQSRVAGQSGQHACPVLTKNTRVPLAHSFQRYRSNQVQPERAQQNKEARSTRCSASGHVSINFRRQVVGEHNGREVVYKMRRAKNTAGPLSVIFS